MEEEAVLELREKKEGNMSDDLCKSVSGFLVIGSIVGLVFLGMAMGV